MSTTINQVGAQSQKWLSKGWNKIGGVGGAVGIGFGIMQYGQERDKGKSVPGALASAIATDALWSAAGPLGWAAMGAQLGVGLGYSAYQAGEGYSKQLARMQRPFSNGFQDTQSAYTMRQRAVQAIQQSKLNARSALGNEASYMHR